MGKKDSHVRMSLQTLRVLEVFLENPMEQFSGAMCINAAALHRERYIRSFFDSNLRVGLSAGGNPLILRAQGGRVVGSIG